MNKLKNIRSHLRVGKVYRREHIQKYSNSVDRDLQNLVRLGELKKLNNGLYYVPKKTVFGEVPPDAHNIVKAFLKEDSFLVISPNDYNSLGLGTTQLHNVLVVYNHKRTGKINLAGINLDFRIKSQFPKQLTKEFLLVNLLNQLKYLPEDSDVILSRLETKLSEFSLTKLKRMVEVFGSVKTQKLFKKFISLEIK